MTSMQDAQTEYIQLCDAEGNFTRVGLRSENCFIDKPDFCAVTDIWIFNSEGQFLCSQRGENVYMNAGIWQTYFGGHLKPGETFESSALNELVEETGLEVGIEQLVLVDKGVHHATQHYAIHYAFLWNGDEEKIKSHDSEIATAKWYTFSIYNLSRNSNPKNWCHNISEEMYIKCLKALKIKS